MALFLIKEKNLKNLLNSYNKKFISEIYLNYLQNSLFIESKLTKKELISENIFVEAKINKIDLDFKNLILLDLSKIF